MTSDSDDVADSADQKPTGSTKPPSTPFPKPPEDADHPTGVEQAEKNRDEDPPA